MPADPPSSSSVAVSLLAFAALRPETDDARTALAETLGLAWRPAERRIDPPRAPAAPAASGPAPAPVLPRAATPARPEQPPPDYKFLRPSFHVPITLQAIDEAALSVEPLPRTEPALHLPPPPHEPLLEPRLFRSLMSRLVSTKTETRDVDWRRLERSLKDDRVLKTLPWRLRDTAGRSVTVVVDRSGYMQPFARDQRETLAGLRRLLGRPRVQVVAVQADLDAPEGARLRWREGTPAPGNWGGVALALSSFGLTDPQTAAYASALCAELSEHARAAGVRVAALIPMPAESWPADFCHLLDAAIPWDRTAAASRTGWLDRAGA